MRTWPRSPSASFRRSASPKPPTPTGRSGRPGHGTELFPSPQPRSSPAFGSQTHAEGLRSGLAPMPSGAHQGVNRGRSRSTAATVGGSLEARARQPRPTQRERRPITLPWIIALALIAIVALIVVSFAVHFLFSPWLLVAVAIVAWIKFRPRRSQR